MFEIWAHKLLVSPQLNSDDGCTTGNKSKVLSAHYVPGTVSKTFCKIIHLHSREILRKILPFILFYKLQKGISKGKQLSQVT